jgi:uncharacterized protein (DUF2164 family)
MNFFGTVTRGVSKAVDYVVEKNRKAALVNRIRIVIKNERENESRAYIALGKYYFQNLRDAQNEETEPLCKAAELADQRMKKAFTKLDEITVSEQDEDSCANCHEDCDYCPSYNENPVIEVVPSAQEEEPAYFTILNRFDEELDTAEEAAEESVQETTEETIQEAESDAPAKPPVW